MSNQIKVQPTEAGQKVMFTNPYPTEENLVLIVIEMRGDRCLCESQVDMKFKPQANYMVADLYVIS